MTPRMWLRELTDAPRLRMLGIAVEASEGGDRGRVDVRFPPNSDSAAPRRPQVPEEPETAIQVYTAAAKRISAQG